MQVWAPYLGVGSGHPQLPAPAHIRSAVAGPYDIGATAEKNAQRGWGCLPEHHSPLPYSKRCNWQVAKWLAIDSRAVVLHVPRLLQAACAAMTDVYVYLLARQRSGPTAAGWVRVQ